MAKRFLVVALILRAVELSQCDDPAGLFNFNDTESKTDVLQAQALYSFRAFLCRGTGHDQIHLILDQ